MQLKTGSCKNELIKHSNLIVAVSMVIGKLQNMKLLQVFISFILIHFLGLNFLKNDFQSALLHVSLFTAHLYVNYII